MVQGKKQLNSKPKFAEVVIGDNEAKEIIVNFPSFVRVWYSERVRMVTSPNCIGLSVVISLLTLAERILLRLASMSRNWFASCYGRWKKG